MDVIVGTAGHIDHGKTALVKALTGIDADRLPEEKHRGITIDIGFAEMHEGDVRVGFVDVPGHERFVKNMLAGASGIDIVMLVVAADEGVMPQTREHFDICRLLRVRSGLIVLTKTDIADAEMLELARMDVAELVHGSFLEHAPVFECSSRTGAGIPELKNGLFQIAGKVSRERDLLDTRLPIDRSFAVKGFGAVVTGTLASGEISEGDELELLPCGRKLRVRGIQTHGEATAVAHAGQRTAVNLAAIDHDELSRGMVLTRAGALTTTLVFDAEVEVLKDAPRPLRSRQRVRLHIGTNETLARVAVLNSEQEIAPDRTGYVQFRLESPVAAALGDRFIIRSYSPQRTIGGGRVLDTMAGRHRPRERDGVRLQLSDLRDAADGAGDFVSIYARMAGEKGVTFEELRARTSLKPEHLKRLIGKAVETGQVLDAGNVLVTPAAFESLQSATLSAIERHHLDDKLSRGLQRETLREQLFRRTRPEVFREVIESLQRSGKIALDQDVIKIATHATQLSPAEAKVHASLTDIYKRAGLAVPKLEEALQQALAGSGLDVRGARKLFQLLIDSGDVVAVTGEYYFAAAEIDALVAKLRETVAASGDATIDVARFKDLAGLSRKYAIPLLEYFDRTKVTVRVGDKRKVL
jgi:selenocysteine-specific elongation factor